MKLNKFPYHLSLGTHNVLLLFHFKTACLLSVFSVNMYVYVCVYVCVVRASRWRWLLTAECSPTVFINGARTPLHTYQSE